jgi:hypothetical protein
MNASNVTGAPTTIYGNETAPSTALFGLCQWTTRSSMCYGTTIPIALLLVGLTALLIYHFVVTPQRSALQQAIPQQQSSLMPASFKLLPADELSHVLSGVSDLPLKVFLPRNGLEYLVEPSATMGIASVKDLLKANRLALRDIGIGPKESRLFSRALERRIRLREKMQEVFMSTSSKKGGAGSKAKLSDLTQDAYMRRHRRQSATHRAAADRHTPTGASTPMAGSFAQASFASAESAAAPPPVMMQEVPTRSPT